MQLPIVRGVIQRRILVNYRVEPDVLAGLLPPPFRPQLVRGWGVAGICLIRLGRLRPRGLPAVWGVSSENAAHRMAVEWDEGGETRRGVYIPRRDTSAWFNVAAGGRLFPGLHHRADFECRETDDELSVEFASRDGSARVAVAGRVAQELPLSALFTSLDEASDFFRGGALGYSATGRPGRYEGLELETDVWQITPLAEVRATSSFFDDPQQFPAGMATLDSAFLMRDIPHQWHSRGLLTPRELEAVSTGVARATDPH